MGPNGGSVARVADPDPDPDLIRIQSGQWIRRAKMTHKSRKKIYKFMFRSVWMASFES
jgi:hypothetical protein